MRIFPAVASLAQLAERSLRKGKVTCSNPVGGTFTFCHPAPPTLGYALLDLPYSHCVPSQHRSVYFRLCGGLRPIRERKKETPTLWSPAVAQNSTHAPQTAATVPAPPAPAELDRGKDNPHSTAAAEQAATASGGPAAFYLLLFPRLLFCSSLSSPSGSNPCCSFTVKKMALIVPLAIRVGTADVRVTSWRGPAWTRRGGCLELTMVGARPRHRRCGPMDKAPAYGAGDSRFESVQW